MFRKFFEFAGENNKQNMQSIEEFLEYCSGKSFLSGLYRIHNTEDTPQMEWYCRQSVSKVCGKD